MANIKELVSRIKESEMKQNQIAEAMNITGPTLSRKLAGKSKITTAEAEKLSIILKFSPQQYRTIFFCDNVAR